jgi:uncharacterized membrane protein
MELKLAEWFADFPSQIATFLIAMIPVGELRGAIPIAIHVYDMPWWSAFFWAVLGNAFVVALILLLLEPVSKILMRLKIFKRFFDWLFERTRSKHSERFEKWGALALVTFVAIPLPITGGWTGSVAAFVFGKPFKKAFPLIFLGLLIAGVIVTALSLGIGFSVESLSG